MIAVLALSTLLAAPAVPQMKPEKDRLAMVISGGSSLGAYQAGVTYALLRELVAERESGGPLNPFGAGAEFVATGSSAGNINAFLAAVAWCDAKAEEDGPFTNVIFKSWASVGWDLLSPDDPSKEKYSELFERPFASHDLEKPVALFAKPPLHFGDADPSGWNKGGSIYSEEDGLLTRRAFRAAEDGLYQRLREQRYRKGCAVRIGLTVTEQEPVNLNQSIRIRTQRSVVPLLLTTPADCSTDLCRLQIFNLLPEAWKEQDHRAIGHSIALVAERDKPVSEADAFALIRASSAFPIAFAPQSLQGCEVTADKGKVLDGCPEGMVRFNRRFVDGGLFDNIPLGLALELVHLEEGVRPGKAPVAHPGLFYYVHPAFERDGVPEAEAGSASSALDLGFGLLSSFVEQARLYELQGIQRNLTPYLGGEEANRLRTTSRFFPLVGNLEQAFAAFFADSFRLHDYLIGIYDGLYAIEERRVKSSQLPGDQVAAATRARVFDELADGAPADTPAARILKGDKLATRLVRAVAAYERRVLDHQEPDEASISPSERREREADLKKPVWAVFQALQDLDHSVRSGARLERRRPRAIDLESFLDRLYAVAKRRNIDEEVFLGDRSQWNHRTIDRLVRRALDVERADYKLLADQNEWGRPVLQTARLLAASLLERDAPESFHFDLDPSSLSRLSQNGLGRAFLTLFPYQVTLDLLRQNLELMDEPKIRFGRFLVPIGAGVRFYPNDPRESEATARPPAWAFKTLLGVGYDPPGRLLDDAFLAATYGGFFRRDFNPAVGLEAAVYLLGNKVRVSVGAPNFFWKRTSRDGTTSGSFDVRDWYVGIGAGDFNGNLYAAFSTAWQLVHRSDVAGGEEKP